MNTGTSYADTMDAEILDAEPTTQPTAIVPITRGQSASSDVMAAYAPMIAAAANIPRVGKEKIERAKWIGALLGKAGFYEFPIGGKPVSGPSIDMAQALAQDWGGIAYQVAIVNEENLASGGKRVHLRAMVVDLKAIVMASVDQVVATPPPSKGFAGRADQAERWHAMQLQNAASKIVRNAILRVLPAWYVDAAFDAAVAAASSRALNGRPLPEVRKATIQAFSEFSITADDLAAQIGQAVDLWAVPQIEAARELYRDLKQGRLSVEQLRASSAEPVRAAGSAALGVPKPAQPAPAPASVAPPVAPPTAQSGDGCP